MKRVAAIVAAAGCGRRYGADRKLLATLDGRPILAWTLDFVGALPLAERLIVLAAEDAVGASLAERAGFRAVVNPEPAAGFGVSLARGVRALRADIDGALIVLGDMPRVRPASALALLARFSTLDASAVIVPVHRGRRGHPVLFGAAHFPALLNLAGDRGARAVLEAATVTRVEVDDPGILLDIDTPEDLAAASALAPTRA